MKTSLGEMFDFGAQITATPGVHQTKAKITPNQCTNAQIRAKLRATVPSGGVF
jgi:hypothetical protein